MNAFLRVNCGSHLDDGFQPAAQARQKAVHKLLNIAAKLREEMHKFSGFPDDPLNIPAKL